ncbi:MAG: FISUMP domain-containing protein [Bacteroidales bacterium]
MRSLLTSILIISILSCTKEKEENSNPANHKQIIKITGEDANVATKTTLEGLTTKWIATTDRVGIYCAQATGGNVNVVYQASSTTTNSVFTGAMMWGTGDHTFYAYYPYAAGSPGSSEVPVSLPSSQTQAGNSSNHIGTYDFLVATPNTVAQGTTGESTSVNLRYNHVFTILEFKLVSANSEKITQLQLTASGGVYSAAFTSGTIDITQSPPVDGGAYTIAGKTGTTNVATLTITDGVDLTNSSLSTPSIYLMILPGDLSLNNIKISITGDKFGSRTIINKLGTNFKRGSKYAVDQDISLSDIEGNVYKTLKIGTQTWMAENLKTTKYNDGSDIPNITDNAAWSILTTPSYCWYNNDEATYKSTYGAIYNWYAVNTGILCPTGWHVPTYTEWTTLTTYLVTNKFDYGGDGGTDIGKSMANTSGWTSYASAGYVGNDQGTNNSSGFTALPGGSRRTDGDSQLIGGSGFWWCSTESSATKASNWSVVYNKNTVTITSNNKTYGVYVRCVKD